jgi:hypothetical protein
MGTRAVDSSEAAAPLARGRARSSNTRWVSIPGPSGARVQAPSASSSQASRSSARLVARISSRRRQRSADSIGATNLDPPVEIARHQVRRADEVAPPPGRTAEAEDARVLEEAAHQRAHPDPLGQPGNARAQAADAAHQPVDLDPRRRSPVEGIDQLGILQRIDLEHDAAVRRLHLLPDLRERGRAQAGGRDQQLAVAARAPPYAGAAGARIRSRRADRRPPPPRSRARRRASRGRERRRRPPSRETARGGAPRSPARSERTGPGRSPASAERSAEPSRARSGARRCRGRRPRSPATA